MDRLYFTSFVSPLPLRLCLSLLPLLSTPLSLSPSHSLSPSLSSLPPPSPRYRLFERRLAELGEAEGGVAGLTRGYQSYGVQRLEDNSMLFREWAPGARAVYLTVDFSG